jgi:hypothetical protein
VKIEDTKSVWVAWTNTDRTEGRGRRIPLHVCESRETAVRVGRKGCVQGTDCQVTEELAVKVNGKWLYPGVLVPETTVDAQLRAKREAKDAALAKAREAGLSAEDIAALR